MRHDLAIVIISLCRESLIRAVRSVYAQQTDCRMQILVGVDHDEHGKSSELEQQLRQDCPPHINLLWLDVGYSTSQRHGGPHSSHYGGSLRTALSFLADSDIVMYLDDDDWLAPTHCADILAAIQNVDWAFAYSIYSDHETQQGLCIDTMESFGVQKGIYGPTFGGFVRPSGLALRKLKLQAIQHIWSNAKYKQGHGEDRLMFEQLRKHRHRCTGKATVYCSIHPNNTLHHYRMEFINRQGVFFREKEHTESIV